MQPAAQGASEDRRDRQVSLVALALVTIGLGRAVAAHPEFVAQHPQNLAWIGLSLAAGLAWLAAPDLSGLRHHGLATAGYGVVAMLLGFNLQGLVNGRIVRSLLGGEPGLALDLAFGMGAALCQTAGKGAVLLWLRRRHPGDEPDARQALLVAGLAVGLGFGLGEVAFLGSRQIMLQEAVAGAGWLGVGERWAAVGFHIYSAGLVALALADRRAWPIVVVIALHGFEDTLAGGFARGALPISLLALEGIYVTATLLTRATFARATSVKQSAALPTP